MLPLPLPIKEPLWQLGCCHNVERGAMHEVLGVPHYTETDSSCTYGGEEDLWAYEFKGQRVVALCLRVPYEDLVLLANFKFLSEEECGALEQVFSLGEFELYPDAIPV